MKRKLIHLNAFLAFSLLLACGTMAGRKQVIVVDPKPTDATVVSTNSESIDKPKHGPNVIDTTRSWTQTYQIKAFNGHEEGAQQQCGIRWWQSVFPNALITFGNLFVGLGFFATDALSGGLFECDSYFSANTHLPAGPTDVPCKRILVVPPYHPDELISDKLVDLWWKTSSPKLQTCDKLLYNADVKNTLRFLNIDHAKNINFDDIHNEILLRMAQRYQLSHIVLISYKAQKEQLKVESNLYSVLTKDPAKSRTSTSFSQTTPDWFQEAESGFRASNYISLLPNAVKMAFANPGQLANFQEPLGYEFAEGAQSYIKSNFEFNVGSVEHPNGFGTYDYSFSISPNLGFSHVRTEQPYKKRDINNVGENSTAIDLGDLGDPFTYKIKYFYITPSYNARFTWHTPVGAVGLRVGLGLSYLQLTDNLGTSEKAWTTATTYGVTYLAFMSQQTFFFLDTATIAPHRNSLETKLYHEKEWQTFSIGFGYFIPAAHSFTRSLLR